MSGDSRIGTLARMVRGLITLGKVTLSDAAGGLQRLQVETKADEFTDDDTQHLEPFGFTARPPDGAEAVVVEITDEEEAILVVTGRAWRLKGLGKGEAALYNDTDGITIELRNAAGPTGEAKVVVNAPKVEIKADGDTLTPADGALSGQALDPYTGQKHVTFGNASTHTFVKK